MRDTDEMEPLLAAALAEARAGAAEGGLPVGSVVARDGHVLGRGRNRSRQTGDPTTHAEMEAYRDAARQAGGPAIDIEQRLAGADVVTTMMPCPMCAGALRLFGAGRVIVAEARTYRPADTRALLEDAGIEVVIRDHPATIAFTGAQRA